MNFGQSWHWLQQFWQQNADNLIGKIIRLVAYLILLRLLHRLMKFMLSRKFRERFPLTRRLSDNDQRQKTVITIATNAIDYLFIFLYIYIALTIIGFPVQTLLASAGIAGLTIGLAAQDFISDLINGFFIMIEHTYEVGEEIIIDTQRGIVIDVGIRLTILQDRDGMQYFIRNGSIDTVINLSRSPLRIAIDLPIDLTSLTDTDQIIQVLESETDHLYEQLHEQLTVQPTVHGFVRLPSGSYAFRIFYYMDHGNYLSVQDQLYNQYIQRLEKEKIPLRN